MSIISLLKKLPLDLGQGNFRHTTKGKQIALSLIDKLGQEKIVLDVGCRDGYFSKMLKNYGYKVISIDIEKAYQDCQIIDANQPLPFADNTFDLIWCSEVIEHLISPRATIKELRRVLKPTGQAIFTTPNSDFWLYKFFRPFGLTPKKLQNPTHLHFFNLEDIHRFRPSLIYGFFPYAVVKLTIRHFIDWLSPTFVFVIKK